MPFRYGIATMTDGPVLFVRLEVEIDGRAWTGVSSDLLPPKWFTKVAGRPIVEEIAEMLAVIRRAGAFSVGLAGGTAFKIWRDLYDAQAAWAAAAKVPPLLANFGVSLVERALLEAVCRARGGTIAGMLHSDALGVRLGDVHPELGDLRPAAFLSPRPLSAVTLRHTVGLADPLTESDISEADRLTDGLPQSLEASVRAYGLRHFKLKVNGELERDLDRLRRVAEILRRLAPPDHAFSLDGNEQFPSMETFRLFWEKAHEDAGLRGFCRRLLFVEQPLHRDVALGSEAGAELGSWPDAPPVIIDESDATPEDLRRALALGYAGTSHKNCKGVFKGVAHRCLIEHRRLGAGRLLMSGEDLCNIGPVALLQDLAVMTALGIDSVERNGHHYHAGLSQFPEPVREAVLAAHPDLYRRTPAGWPTLRVEQGRVATGTINAAPFGVGFTVEPEWFPAIA